MAECSRVGVTALQRLMPQATLYACKNCRLPIGSDSDQCNLFVIRNVILLKEVTEFVKRGKVQKSNDPHDAGSHYETLYCSQCRSVLGRFYLSTPEHLRSCLNFFNIDKTCIEIYNFGENLQQSVPESEAPVTVEMSQLYLEQIEQQNILLQMLKKRVSRMENKVLPPEMDIDSSP